MSSLPNASLLQLCVGTSIGQSRMCGSCANHLWPRSLCSRLLFGERKNSLSRWERELVEVTGVSWSGLSGKRLASLSAVVSSKKTGGLFGRMVQQCVSLKVIEELKMSIISGLVRESLVTALASYGVVTLMTIQFSSMGNAAELWAVVPSVFILQLLLKLVFSRGADGKLRSSA